MMKTKITRIKDKALVKWQIFQKHPSFYAVCFWLVVLFALFIVADLIVMPVVAGHYAFTSTVPNVVGKLPKEAAVIIGKEDLKVVVDSESHFSPQIPAGEILYQIPAAGRTVKEGRTVHLTLSSGPRSVALPELRGKSLAQAQMSLRILDLIQGKIIQVANPSFPRGVVVRTQPAAGTPIRQGLRVDILVSGGSTSGKQHLPDFTDLDLERASFLIDSLNFKIGKVTRKSAAGKQSGTILEQRPRSGEFLEPGTEIQLTIVD